MAGWGGGAEQGWGGGAGAGRGGAPPPLSPWKRPDEVLQLHRLRKKKLALQERMCQSSSGSALDSVGTEDIDLNFSKLMGRQKRKNPFSKKNTQEDKKPKVNVDSPQLDESTDKTLFALLNLPSTKQDKPTKDLTSDKLTSFSNLLQKYSTEYAVEDIPETKHKNLPIDWALKTKVRLMSPKPFAWDLKLKASEEASGITGYVRCLDTADSNTLDTSHHARFHQNCLYWQHPHLPWINLYPRAKGRVTATSFVATNELVKTALHREWTESFRSLFQLVRARQCPYFYVCANTFTCLFRAAGICGVTETCALISPTTRGFRQTLKQEDVEFTMPLRPDSKRKLNNSDSKDDEKPKNSSYDSCYDTMDDGKSQDDQPQDKKVVGDEDSGDDDDIESDQFLTRLGFEAEQIKKINHTQVRVIQAAESNVDLAAESMVFIRGVDAQALFNFLLNCKSIISPTGPFGGIPPTLLAPTAFQGGTLQALKVRDSTVYSDNKKYYSIELRGAILPTTIHSLFALLKSNTSHFSATFANLQSTLAFSQAAQAIADDELSKENEQKVVPNAFNKENLSDCGVSSEMLEQFCSADPSQVKSLDSLKYTSEDGMYTW